MKFNKNARTFSVRFARSLNLSHVLILLLIAVLLSGCGSNRITTQTEYLYPPQAYLHACPKTAFMGNTYGDALDYLITVKAERDLCASQIEHINHWIHQTKASQ